MDEIDKKILGNLVFNGPLSMKDLVYNIFVIEDKYDYHKQCSFLRNRIKKMILGGLIQHDSLTNRYSLSPHQFGICNITIGESEPVELGPTILFSLQDQYCVVFLESG